MSHGRANEIGVMMGKALKAAENIHLAMCSFPKDHRGQAHLVDAMHSVLILAEEARQQWGELLNVKGD